MRLTEQQVRQFDEDGYLFLPDCFSPEEVAALRTEAVSIYDTDRPEVWREKSGAPRTAFAAHTYNEAFRLLGAHPRLPHPICRRFNVADGLPGAHTLRQVARDRRGAVEVVALK